MKVLEVISAPHARRVAEALDALRAEGPKEGYISFMFVMERPDGSTTCGVTGRYRNDPMRALGELSVMKTRLAHFAARQKEEREQIDFEPTGT